MKKAISVIFILVLIFSLSVCFTGCNEDPEEETDIRGFSDKDNPYLVLYDDFTSETIDSNLWNIYGQDKGSKPHIRRGAYWDPRQVFTQNNALVIRTQKREDGYYYTGAIDSHNKYEKGYGYYEARCKMPKATGLWSAFWIMSKQMEEGTAPGTSDVTRVGAEIDIMESPYYNSPLFGTEHYQYNVHVGDYAANYLMYSKEYPLENIVQYSEILGSEEPVSLYEDWHTFGLEWTEEQYCFYIDRKVVGIITDERFISPLEGFLFLSVEVDGATKTVTDSNGNKTDVPDAFPNLFEASLTKLTDNPDGTFPVDFLIDWVAIYSQKPF